MRHLQGESLEGFIVSCVINLKIFRWIRLEGKIGYRQ